MIFLTVGAQMPFDRLVRAVDEWAGRALTEVFAQIGSSGLRPRNVRWTRFLEPRDFLTQVSAADLLVAHAGMGSIITALEYSKPILVMPRRGDLGETRNDHQVATAQRFRGLGRIEVAFDEQELVARLDGFTAHPQSNGVTAVPCPHRSAGCAWATAAPCQPHPGMACPQLIAALRDFIGAGSLR